MFEWELRGQAFQNSVMPAMCNRVGAEDEMHFSGESIVVDAHGNVLIKADDTEQIVYVDADLSTVKRYGHQSHIHSSDAREFSTVT